MVGAYATKIRDEGGSPVKVLADAYWFGAWFTKYEQKTGRDSDMLDADELSTVMRNVFVSYGLFYGKLHSGGINAWVATPDTPDRQTEPQMSEYFWEIHGGRVWREDQTHHFAYYFTVSKAWALYALKSGQHKSAEGNPGDYLLTVVASDIGDWYRSTHPSADELRDMITKTLSTDPNKNNPPEGFDAAEWKAACEAAEAAIRNTPNPE